MNTSKPNSFKAFLPIVGIFITAMVLPIIGNQFLTKKNIDVSLVNGGNIVLFLVSAISFFIYLNAIKANNTAVFLRNVYSGMLAKFFISAIVAFVYLISTNGKVNTASLLIVMASYLVYTFVEVSILLKLSKDNKNG